MKKILSIVCVFMLAIMLTACGSSKLSGTYKLIQMESGDSKYDENDLKSSGITMELRIVDDKKAVLSVDGQEVSLTYDDKTFTGKDQVTGEEESIPYTLDGNKIILNDDGEIMTFKK